MCRQRPVAYTQFTRRSISTPVDFFKNFADLEIKEFLPYITRTRAKQALLEQATFSVMTVCWVLTSSCSAWASFDTDGCNFPDLYPGLDVRALTLESNFRLPFVREFLLFHGVCDVSKQTCLNVLAR